MLPLKILIVDDKPENLVSLKVTLRHLENVEIISATNGIEALEVALNHDFALVILDIQMPEMDGYELAGFLRDDEKTRHIPLIFMSAVYTDEYHAYHSKTTGEVDFLMKPYNPKILLNKTGILIALQRQKQELEEVNQNLTLINAELQAAQGQLIQNARLASLGEMATGLAHELNNPLAVINMSACNGIESLEHEDYEYAKQSFEVIESNVKRSADIINNLRAFARGTDDADFDLEDPNELVQNAIMFVGEQLRQKRIEISLELAEGLPDLLCNGIQIEQLLIDLIRNSRDALAYKEEKRLIIRTRNEDAKTIIEVEDSGCGISEEALPRIFDPFFTTKEVGEGVGLGLSVGYGIVQDHDGELLVESKEGEGAIFQILFPSQY